MVFRMSLAVSINDGILSCIFYYLSGVLPIYDILEHMITLYMICNLEFLWIIVTLIG